MGCNFCTSCLWVFLQLVSGIRGMAQQRDLFSDLLRNADYMKAFVSQRKNSEEDLRLRLKQAEASLSVARSDNEALRMELAKAKILEESTDARLLEVEDEMTLLRGGGEETSGGGIYREKVERGFAVAFISAKRRVGG